MLSEVKATARKRAFAARKAAFDASGAAAAEAAAAQFLAAVPVAPGATVGGYRPIRTEIDPTPLMRALHEAGARLSVPVIEAAGRPLSFRAWTPDTQMTEGAFGAEIPASGDHVTPELLITPLVAFDAAFFRLGYGGGFYDRTLEQLRAGRPPGAVRAIGLAFAAQEIPETPREATDQQLDGVVTELGARLR